MSVFSEIVVFQLAVNGANHGPTDTVVGVYEMTATDQGGLDAFNNPTTADAIEEASPGSTNPSQSFQINGTTYFDVSTVDNGSIEIDGVVIEGAFVTLTDPNTGLNTEFFIPLQSDAVDAATVTDTSVITTPFAVTGVDANALAYSDMYTPPNDVVLGTDGDDSIDASYLGDPGQDRVDDPLRASSNDTIFAGHGDDTIDAGAGNDFVLGQSGDDKFIVKDGLEQDVYIGGETGEVQGDSIDASALTTDVTLDLSQSAINGYKAIVLDVVIDETNPNLYVTMPEIEAVAKAQIIDNGQDTNVSGSSADKLESGSDQGDQGNTSIFMDGVNYTTFGGVYALGLLTSDGNMTGYAVSAYAEGSTDPVALYFPDLNSDFPAVSENSTIFGWSHSGGGQTDMPYSELIPMQTAAGGTLTNGTNTISFSEMETYRLGLGDDTVIGSDDGDTIDAGAGDDVIQTGSGRDSINAGSGNDSINAGAGNDTIVLTQGNDTIATGLGDDRIEWAGAGDITIQDFGRDDSGSFNDGDQANNDFIDLSQYYSKLKDLRADLEDDGILNQSAGDYSQSAAMAGSISFLDQNGDTYLSSGDLTFDNTNVACFSADVGIQTPDGERPVGDIRPGDWVETVDHGRCQVRWVGHREMTHDDFDVAPNLMPVRIKRGALGQATPHRDLIVSPQHRILLRSALAEKVCGKSEVLVAAKRLLGLPGIEKAWDVDALTYVHIMFDRHEILWANGAESESFFAGAQAVNGWDMQTKAELFEILPELASTDVSSMMPARPFATGKDARHLVAQHVRTTQRLVEKPVQL